MGLIDKDKALEIVCRHCGACSAAIKALPETDALKMLVPKLMTLDEVRRCGYHVFIELKDKNGPETIGSTDPEDLKEFKSLYSAFWHFHWRAGDAMLEEFYLGIPSERNYQETNKYNVTWRCWDKLPSDQIMEATPWD